MTALAERLTVDEYLAFDRAAERPHEYIQGSIHGREDANRHHCQILSNILMIVGNALKTTPFRVYAPHMRVRAAANVFLYPDTVIGWGTAVAVDSHNDILIDPVVVFEVVSPTTELRDRGIKFEHYRGISSLDTYVLISQTQPQVNCYSRATDLGGWLLNDAQGLEEIIHIPRIEIDLPLADLYDRVEFPTTEVLR